MEESKNVFVDKYLTPVAVLLGAVIIAGAFIFGHPASQQGTTGQPVAVKVDIKDVKTEGVPFIGNANAPVTIALWMDYQCPYCKAYDVGGVPQIKTPPAMPDIIKNYVDTGKVKVVFKDFEFLGEDSTTAGEFGRALWEAYPDHFFEWHQAMFTAQDDEGDTGFGNLDSIKALTAKIQGVDVNKVVALMNQKKEIYDAAITADRDEAQTFGIGGTPGTIIGTTMLSGARPYDELARLIDAELKK